MVIAQEPFKLHLGSILDLRPQGVLFGHYGVMHVEESFFRWPTTYLHCPLVPYKALKTHLQFQGHVIIARQPFKLYFASFSWV